MSVRDGSGSTPRGRRGSSPPGETDAPGAQQPRSSSGTGAGKSPAPRPVPPGKRGDDEGERLERRSPPEWVFRLAAVVIVIGVLAPIGLAIGSGDRLIQYRISIALLCFALSSLAGLLFVVRSARLEGTIGVLAVTVAGPAAAWLITLLIFSVVFSEARIASPPGGAAAPPPDQGGLPYHEWTLQRDVPLSQFAGSHEEPNVTQLLSAVYDRGFKKSRLEGAEIRTLLLLYGMEGQREKCSGVKLQLVAGRKERSLDLYQTSLSTRPGDRPPSSVLFHGDPAAGVPLSPLVSNRNGGTWQSLAISSDTFRGLVVGHYPGGILAEGDWFMVHVPKYTRAGSSAAVDLHLLSTSPLRRSYPGCLWEVRARGGGSSDDEVPLLFRQLQPQPTERPLAADHDFLEALQPWLPALDRYLGSGEAIPAARTFLQTVLQDLPRSPGAPGNPAFAGLLRHEGFAHHYEFRAPRVSNPVLASFNWRG